MRLRNMTLALAAVLSSVFLYGCPAKGPEIGVDGEDLQVVAGGFQISFTLQETEMTFTIANVGNGDDPLEYRVETDREWILVDPDEGSLLVDDEADTITVTIDRAAKQLEGVNSGTITIFSPDDSVDTVEIAVLASPEYFTEQFDGDFDIDMSTLSFVPSEDSPGVPSISFYDGFIDPATELPQAPDGGLIIDFNFADPFGLPLEGDAVSLYGIEYDEVQIGSDGSLTFLEEDVVAKQTGTSLGEHFANPRVSALGADLDPDAGTVSVFKTLDSVVFTYEDVMEQVSGELSTFQIEMHYDGTIQMTYAGVGATKSTVGLSFGGGVPTDFAESDLSAFNTGFTTTTVK